MRAVSAVRFSCAGMRAAPCKRPSGLYCSILSNYKIVTYIVPAPDFDMILPYRFGALVRFYRGMMNDNPYPWQVLGAGNKIGGQNHVISSRKNDIFPFNKWRRARCK